MTVPAMPATETSPSSGGRLVSQDGKLLPFRGCSLETEARGGLARVVLRQTFINESDDPLQVTYQMPLPADAAVGAYTFIIGDRRVVGEIERREAARERFEEAILEGRTAALLEQDRSSVFTQEIGNIPAHTEVTCELVLDQKLRWLEDGQWEWRFPTVIAPRYMGEEGRVKDAKRIIVDVSEQELPARATLSMKIRDHITNGEPSCATHPLVIHTGDESTELAFKSEDGVALDRDIVVRWSAAAPEVGVSLDTARPVAAMCNSDATYGLLTLTPPSSDSIGKAIARDLIVLIDTSGSMSGQPLVIAKSVVLEIIDSLDVQDSLELIEFSTDAHRWSEAGRPATPNHKQAAADWVRALNTGGCTEMQTGLEAALSPLRADAQRQVLLVSDGLVGFDDEIVEIVRTMTPRGCRVHSIGIGSAANRSLTQSVARAGGGAEFLIDFDDDLTEAASRIITRISKPLCVDVAISGDAVLDVARSPIPDLLAGAPSIVPMKLNPAGGEVVVDGRTAEGPWTQRIRVDACETASGSESISRLYGREKVEELELDAAVGEDVDEAIEEIGLGFQISTRLTSWIAISEEATVDPREPVRRVRIPQQLPYGMSVEGLGLRNLISTKIYDIASPTGVYCRSAKRLRHENEFEARHMLSQTVRLKRSRPLQISRSAIVLRGFLRSRSDGQIVIEFEIDSKIDWRPDHVIVRGEPGAILDLNATTKDGDYTTGQTIRLVLTGITPGIDVTNKSCIVHMKAKAQEVRLYLRDPNESKPRSEQESVNRVFELARELEVKSAVILEMCQSKGITLETRMSRVSKQLQKKIRQWLQSAKED